MVGGFEILFYNYIINFVSYLKVEVETKSHNV